jgi:hypothetical protein
LDWISVLKLAAGITSALSGITILGALYLWLASQRGERSLREIISGEDIARSEQVVNILKTFNSDEQRLEALRAILGSDDEKFRRILSKVKSKVDVGRLSLKQQSSWSVRLTIVGAMLLSLAIIAFLFSGAETRNSGMEPVDNPKVDQPLLQVLRRLPHDQVASALAFIPRGYWDHAVSSRSDLPIPDWSAFEIFESTDLFSLERWKPFAPGAIDLVSPVFVEGELVVAKRRPVEQFRVAFGTEGVALVVACVSPQPYDVEIGPASGVVKTNLVTEAHLVIDVRRYQVGEKFRLKIRGIMWNGLLPDDPWVALVSLADGGMGKIVVTAPSTNRLWNIGFFRYPHGQKEAINAKGEGTQLVGTEGGRVMWEIDRLEGNCVYEIQWTFVPASP